MLLTIDIGTSVFKTAVFDLKGKRHFYSEVQIAGNSGAYEIDPGLWISALETSCARIKNKKDINAVVISGNGPSLVPVLGSPQISEEGVFVPAYPARLWLDRRSVVEAEKVSELMGGFVDAAFFLPKILNIRDNEAGLYEKTECFLGCPEFLAFALTGQALSVIPSPGFERWFWNDDAVEKLKLDARKLPPFISPGDLFGRMLPLAAEKFGFSKNIPVVSGGPDFFAAILGSGVCSPGQCCDRSGTSEGVNVCTETKISDKRLMAYGHPVKPYWNLSGVISTTGKAIEWCRDLLNVESYDKFTSLAMKSGAGAGGMVFLPYLAGERAPLWDPDARGVWKGFGLSSGREEFARSVLEGICFAVRDVIAVMEEAGAKTEELCVTGGGAQNNFLNQLKADITGKAVSVPVYPDAELAGLAVIGTCVLGEFGSFKEAVQKFIAIGKRFEPDRQNSGLYLDLFQKYKNARA
jgi:xylulokinase